MAKIKDPNAGVPGGYFLAEDGETYINAKGEPVEKMSDAELAKYPVHQVKPDPSRTQAVARVVTVTQAELDKEAKAQAKAAHDASTAAEIDPAKTKPAKPRTSKKK